MSFKTGHFNGVLSNGSIEIFQRFFLRTFAPADTGVAAVLADEFDASEMPLK